MTEGYRMTTINDLSNDELVLIFKEMDLKTRDRCELVCRRWRHLAECLKANNYKIKVQSDFDRVGSSHKTTVKNHKYFCLDASHGIHQAFTIKDTQRGKSLLKKHVEVVAVSLDIHDPEILFEYLLLIARHFTQLEHLEVKTAIITSHHIGLMKLICPETLKHICFRSPLDNYFCCIPRGHLWKSLDRIFKSVNIEQLYLYCPGEYIVNLPLQLRKLIEREDGEWDAILTEATRKKLRDFYHEIVDRVSDLVET